MLTDLFFFHAMSFGRMTPRAQAAPQRLDSRVEFAFVGALLPVSPQGIITAAASVQLCAPLILACLIFLPLAVY